MSALTREDGLTIHVFLMTTVHSVVVCVPYYSWNPPTGRTGPDPVVQRNFDCPYGLVLMEGTDQAAFPLIQGKVSTEVTTMGNKNSLFTLDPVLFRVNSTQVNTSQQCMPCRSRIK